MAFVQLNFIFSSGPDLILLFPELLSNILQICAFINWLFYGLLRNFQWWGQYFYLNAFDENFQGSIYRTVWGSYLGYDS